MAPRTTPRERPRGGEIDRHVAHRWRHVEGRPVQTLDGMRLDIPDEVRKRVMVGRRATGIGIQQVDHLIDVQIGVDLRRRVLHLAEQPVHLGPSPVVGLVRVEVQPEEPLGLLRVAVEPGCVGGLGQGRYTVSSQSANPADADRAWATAPATRSSSPPSAAASQRKRR